AWRRTSLDELDSRGGPGGALPVRRREHGGAGRAQQRGAESGDECRVHQGASGRGASSGHLSGAAVRTEGAVRRDERDSAGEPEGPSGRGRSGGLPVSFSAVGSRPGGSASELGCKRCYNGIAGEVLCPFVRTFVCSPIPNYYRSSRVVKKHSSGAKPS